MNASTAAELLKNPVVRRSLEQAWADSQPDNPSRRHEEGGWIYINLVSGEIEVRRAPSGATAAIDLRHPPIVGDSVVVGKFHTHPNPTAEGWEPGPSDSDREIDAVHGVPDLIRADDEVYVSGPTQRRGGLAGDAGYPG